MCFWTVLDHWDAIWVHFEQNLKIDFFDHFGLFWAIWGPFWPFLDPFWTPKWSQEPKKTAGNLPKLGKRGSKGHKNVFWDRFRPFGCHFSAFRVESKNQFFFRLFDHFGLFWAILGPFWPFLDPFWTPKWPQKPKKTAGNLRKLGKRGSKGHN